MQMQGNHALFFSRNVFKIGQIADRGLRSRRGLRYYIIKDIHRPFQTN